MTIAEARRTVGEQIGITNDGSIKAYQDLTQAEQIRLMDAVFDYIAKNPAYFTASQVALAAKNIASSHHMRPLEDTSFDWGEFGDEVVNNAGEIVKGVGSTTKNLLYLAVVVAVVAYVLPAGIALYQKTKASQ